LTVRERLLGITRDNDDRAIIRFGADLGVAQLGNAEIQALNLVEDVVWKVAGRLVDLVDEHD
jgi:hypothetical protein